MPRRRSTDYIDKKHALYSRTVWVNIITVALACVSLVSTDPFFAQYDRYILLAVGILNIILRAITTDGVAFTGPVNPEARLAEGRRRAQNAKPFFDIDVPTKLD